MKRMLIVAVLTTLAPAGWFSSTLRAEELEEGTWSGSLRLGNQSLPANLEVKRVQDPHWRWRPGGEKVLSVTQGGQPVSDILLESGKLTYSAGLPPLIGGRINCSLELQEDGTYAGTCVLEGEEVGQAAQITLTPPAGPS